MKKLSLFLIGILLIFSGCHSEEKLPQFVATSTHQEFLENGVVTGTSDYFCTLDENGRVIGIEDYTDDVLTYRSFLEYDEFGNTLRVTTEKNGATEIYEYQNTLDLAGRILRQEVWNGDKLCSIEEHAYDERGNETSRSQTDWYEGEDEPSHHTYTMTYDRKGNLIRKELHSSLREKYTLWEYEAGLCILETSYYEDTDQLAEKIETIYDKQGNQIQRISYNPVTGKIAERWEYSYDAKGRCVREAHYSKTDQLQQYQEYVYDDTARTMTSTPYHADGTAIETSVIYTYDEYGNEIMREYIQNGVVGWRICHTYETVP